MKLIKKHIGQVFEVDGSDGSWWYRLLDIKRGKLLFQDNDGNYWVEKQSKHHDWRSIDDLVHNSLIKEGWKKVRQI